MAATWEGPILDDPVALAAWMIARDTAGRDECTIAEPLLGTLRAAGFDVRTLESAPGRVNVVATWAGGGRLVLTGHLDTVPFEPDAWTHVPTSGVVAGGWLYGRGSSDMKGGVAAMVVAALRAASGGADGFTLAFTVGEETGCIGARDLAAAGLLPERPILIVGESTENTVRFGHKGATWLRVTAHGTQSHGSRPELGDNAIARLAHMVVALEDFGVDDEHPHLGRQTVNVGRITGGLQTNLVPDRATAELDFRTVPGADLESAYATIRAAAPRNEIETLLDLAPVWTDGESALSRRVTSLVQEVTGTAETGAVSYFTDAAVMSPGTASVYVIGPGNVDQPHTVDERCSVDRIIEAERIYRRLIGAVVELESL